MRCAHEQKILDATVRDRDELEYFLGQVAAVNRFLGGDRALRSAHAPLAAETGEARLVERALLRPEVWPDLVTSVRSER